MPVLQGDCKGRTEQRYRFFLIALCHNDLGAYYQTNFSLMQHHGYSLAEVENMIPWEREVYIQMLISHMKKEREKTQNRKQV